MHSELKGNLLKLFNTKGLKIFDSSYHCLVTMLSNCVFDFLLLFNP